MTLLDRFLKYISVWTTSEEGTGKTPSTDRQLKLAEILEAELKEVGVPEVSSEMGYVRVVRFMDDKKHTRPQM